MAEGPGRAQGTIAVVLGMADSWAGMGIQSHKGLPRGETEPTDPKPPCLYCRWLEASRCFSQWLVT